VECSDEGLIHELLCVPGHGRFRFVAVRPYDRIGGNREIQKIIYIYIYIKGTQKRKLERQEEFRRGSRNADQSEKRRFAQLVDGCAPRCGAVQVVERVEKRKEPKERVNHMREPSVCCLSQK
jgi:hypothetical protein